MPLATARHAVIFRTANTGERTMKFAGAFVGFLLLGTTAANAANPIAGIWAGDPAWCAFKSQIGTHDPAPIRITETGIEGMENRCTIQHVAPLATKSAWSVTEKCSGEGSSYVENDVYMIDGDGKLLQFSDGILTTFTHCK
jgi:hypothetical protein